MSDPLYCVVCGKSLVEVQRFTRWDEYLGVRLYRKSLQCPEYGKFFRGDHSRWNWTGDDGDGYWSKERSYYG